MIAARRVWGMDMTGRVIGIALAISLLAAPAYAAQARKKAPEPPPPPPPQFRVDVATRTMALARLEVGFPATSTIGEAGYSSLGCADTRPIYATNAFGVVSKDDYAKVFAGEARAASYKEASSQTDLFASGDSSKPELQVGAAIVSLSEKACPSFDFLGYRPKVQATMRIEWQVFDPLEKKLLFRATNEGSANVSGRVVPYEEIGRSYTLMVPDAARDAFQQAAKAILADPNFVAAVRDPKGGTPTEANALFPEAQNASPPAALPVQIIRLTPSMKPFKDQVAQLREQVVTVDNGAGTGSGFYVADGLLLTNHHVIAGSERVKIRFFGGRQIDGQVIASNAKRDVALIKTDGAGVAGLPLRLENPELTSQVFVIGSPLGEKHEGSITSGIVSAFRDEASGPFIQSDVSVDHGNSGGPMFDAQGNVIGLVDLGLGGRATVNLFIPIGDALKVLDIRFAP